MVFASPAIIGPRNSMYRHWPARFASLHVDALQDTAAWRSAITSAWSDDDIPGMISTMTTNMTNSNTTALISGSLATVANNTPRLGDKGWAIAEDIKQGMCSFEGNICRQGGFSIAVQRYSARRVLEHLEAKSCKIWNKSYDILAS